MYSGTPSAPRHIHESRPQTPRHRSAGHDSGLRGDRSILNAFKIRHRLHQRRHGLLGEKNSRVLRIVYLAAGANLLRPQSTNRLQRSAPPIGDHRPAKGLRLHRNKAKILVRRKQQRPARRILPFQLSFANSAKKLNRRAGQRPQGCFLGPVPAIRNLRPSRLQASITRSTRLRRFQPPDR